MRFSLVPIFIAALLAVGPTTVHAITNQAAAEKIAANLGEQFPGYDIEVSYQNGKVRLAGQVESDAMLRQTLEQVQRVPGVQVSEIENGLRVLPRQNQLQVPAVKRETPVSLAPVSVSPNMPIPQDDRCLPGQRNQVASAPIPMPNRPQPQMQPVYTPPRPDVLQVSAQQPSAAQAVVAAPAAPVAAPAPLKQPVPLQPQAQPQASQGNQYAQYGKQCPPCPQAQCPPGQCPQGQCPPRQCPPQQAQCPQPQQAQCARGYADQYSPEPCPCGNHGPVAAQPRGPYAGQPAYPAEMGYGPQGPAPVGYMQGPQGAAPMGPQAGYAAYANANANGYAGEPYGPQGPMPGNYNNPNLPEYAWPSYAAYPNYAEVCYPKQYSPKAWPYIGPFYPYPQAPLGWRQVTMEWHDGWWWLDFDDGSPSGPFSPLFRQPIRYTY